jgi:hypothetical protein
MIGKPSAIRRQDWLRYGLWLLVAQTAFANRQYYRMATTWLPHFLTNSLSLLLPDALRVVFPPDYKSRTIVDDTLVTMVRDNPNYAVYVAPLALGYIVSHPRFNIYKGDLAELRLAGFGLDAIPHSATAFAFSAIVEDTLSTMCETQNHHGLLADAVYACGQKSELAAFTLLALVTLGWEYAEYRTHKHEMALRGDATAINMQWTLEDTIRDIGANLAGWVAAAVWGRRKQR